MFFQLDGAMNVFKQEFKSVGLLFLESKAPHSIFPCIPDIGFMNLAEQEMVKPMDQYKICMKENKWDSLPEIVYDAAPPYWSFRETE